MPYVLIRHKVDDYTKWKPVFDEHAAARKAAGSRGGILYRNVDEPEETLILVEVDDLEKMRQFFQSEDLREAMQRGGVSDRPDVYFLDEGERFSA